MNCCSLQHQLNSFFLPLEINLTFDYFNQATVSCFLDHIFRKRGIIHNASHFSLYIRIHSNSTPQKMSFFLLLKVNLTFNHSKCQHQVAWGQIFRKRGIIHVDSLFSFYVKIKMQKDFWHYGQKYGK